ncbi:hypothetical protein P5673_027989 [Acropora cervicornis]|uniref:Uncharacterized protein n=1 Tax=Acropora cervicornis TaxID=6130 RepID=A0AAD9UV84_ACRCE|nr:hypothetical protein P5673_027989 [Acropora cervicornis]
MEYVHHPVAPTVLAFLVVLCGTGTLERAPAQSTGGALGPTPASLLLPSPSLANAPPLTNSSTQGAVLTSRVSPAIELPNQPAAEAVPSMGFQTPTYTGNTHRSRHPQPTASLQNPSVFPFSPLRPPVGLPFSRPLPPPGNPFLRPGPPTGNPFLRPGPPTGNPFLRPGPPTGNPFLRPGPPTGNPFLRPGPPTGNPFLRPGPPTGNPFLRPGPPPGNPFLRPGPPSGFPFLPTHFCPPVGRHRMGPPDCPLSPHHPSTVTSRPYPHDNSFPDVLPFPQSMLEGISTERVPPSILVTTQPPQTLKSVTSFLLNSTRWNCTPAMAMLDGMFTVS